MKTPRAARSRIGLVVALAGMIAACLPAVSRADEHGAAPWGYGKDDGPASWGKLSPDYALCAIGKAQTQQSSDTGNVRCICLRPVLEHAHAD